MKGDEVIKTGEESSDCLLFSHIWYVNRIWLNVLVIDLRNWSKYLRSDKGRSD